jgi:hypothetical protein
MDNERKEIFMAKIKKHGKNMAKIMKSEEFQKNLIETIQWSGLMKRLEEERKLIQPDTE